MNSPNVADILIEALPYIRQFSGMTIVVKYGGHAMVDEQLKDDFARDITLLKFVGLNPVVVHGGGPQINKVLDQMGISSTFVKGMRLTDEPTMDVVEMVLGGKVNKSIVAQINKQGGRAVGLSGKDGGLIQAKKLKILYHEDENKPPEIIDPGLVGDVTAINPEIIHTLTSRGFIPIIAPVGAGKSGETYNINADLVASHIATALSAGLTIDARQQSRTFNIDDGGIANDFDVTIAGTCPDGHAVLFTIEATGVIPLPPANARTSSRYAARSTDDASSPNAPGRIPESPVALFWMNDRTTNTTTNHTTNSTSASAFTKSPPHTRRGSPVRSGRCHA